MVQETKILNTREIKRINELLAENFGYFPKTELVFFQNNKNRIFLVNKDIEKLNLYNLIVDKFGFYFGELKDNTFRLSKEGAEFLFLKAKKDHVSLKNVLELNVDEVKSYFTGTDIEKDLGSDNKPLILTFKGNCLGSTRYKDKKILNFLPKINRGDVIL
jgi:NOL1/NOP2/fmu family ribosome biogenesis protein